MQEVEGEEGAIVQPGEETEDGGGSSTGLLIEGTELVWRGEGGAGARARKPGGGESKAGDKGGEGRLVREKWGEGGGDEGGEGGERSLNFSLIVKILCQNEPMKGIFGSDNCFC